MADNFFYDGGFSKASDIVQHDLRDMGDLEKTVGQNEGVNPNEDKKKECGSSKIESSLSLGQTTHKPKTKAYEDSPSPNNELTKEGSPITNQCQANEFNQAIPNETNPELEIDGQTHDTSFCTIDISSPEFSNGEKLTKMKKWKKLARTKGSTRQRGKIDFGKRKMTGKAEDIDVDREMKKARRT